MGAKMSHDYSEKNVDLEAFLLSTDEESKSYSSESEEEIVLNHYQKVSKQCVNQFKTERKEEERHYTKIGSIGDQDDSLSHQEYFEKHGVIVDKHDSLSHQEYFGTHAVVQTTESSAQTDSVENTVAVQADVIPKISHGHFQNNQFVQTEEKYFHGDDSVYSRQDWDSNKSEYSESSNSVVSETHPFTKVIALSCIPITMKHQQDYVGDLEEKAYRVSRWLHENIDSSDSGSEPDFTTKPSHTNNLTKKVSFCKTISPTVPPMHHYHWNAAARTDYSHEDDSIDQANDLTKKISFSKTISPTVPPMHHYHRNAVAQTDYSHEDDSIDPVQSSDTTKQSDYHVSEWQRKNFRNRFGQNDVFFNKIDYDMLAKTEEVKRELLSKTAKILKPSKAFSDEDLKPNYYKTMNATHVSLAIEEDSFLKPEPLKVRKRFSNYLKGQYRNLSDDTMGKSYMMMQDLKEVLRKRGISN